MTDLDYSTRVPFDVSLPDGRTLHCHSLARVLPGKRLVCAAELDGNAVYAKVFHVRHQWQQELNAYTRAGKAGLPVPGLLYSTVLDDQYLIITRAIENSESLLDHVTDNHNAIPIPVLDSLMKCYAALHDAGAVHNDPHLGNFLLQGNRLVMMDVAAFGFSGQSPDRDACLDNLALLLAQFPCSVEPVYRHALEMYCRYRNLEAVDGNDMEKRIQHARQRRGENFLKKIWRSSSRYLASHDFFRHTIVRRSLLSDGMHQFLGDPDSAMSKAESRMLKDGNTATVKLVQIDNHKFIVKRYNIKNMFHLLKRAIQPTRAAISWRNANYLEHLGIGTSAPVALIEQRRGPFRGKAWFVMEALEGEDARHFFEHAAVADSKTEDYADRLVNLLYCLHSNRISHGDMKATNFIMTDNTAAVIDLDAMKIHASREAHEKSWKRDMQRFAANWQSRPEVADLFNKKLKRLQLL